MEVVFRQENECTMEIVQVHDWLVEENVPCVKKILSNKHSELGILKLCFVLFKAHASLYFKNEVLQCLRMFCEIFVASPNFSFTMLSFCFKTLHILL